MKKETALALSSTVGGMVSLESLQPEWLYTTAASLTRGSKILEIGSYVGRGTICLCGGAEESGSTVLCVSTFWEEKDKEEFHKNTKQFLDSVLVRLIEENSYIALPRLIIEGYKADFIFVDADHEYLSASLDIFHSRFLLNPGGTICVHDYHEGCFPGVYKAVGDMLHLFTDVQRCQSMIYFKLK